MGKGGSHAKWLFVLFWGMVWEAGAKTFKNRRAKSVALQHLSWDGTASDKSFQRFAILDGP